MLNHRRAGKWNGFGGKLEPGETLEQCAARELEEVSLHAHRASFACLSLYLPLTNSKRQLVRCAGVWIGRAAARETRSVFADVCGQSGLT